MEKQSASLANDIFEINKGSFIIYVMQLLTLWGGVEVHVVGNRINVTLTCICTFYFQLPPCIESDE
jgi:hypothetical protein